MYLVLHKGLAWFVKQEKGYVPPVTEKGVRITVIEGRFETEAEARAYAAKRAADGNGYLME